MDKAKTKYWIKVYGIIAAILLAIHYSFNLEFFESWGKVVPFMQKLSMSLFLIFLIFFVSKIITRVVNNQTHNEGDRYNLMRIIRFLAIAFSLIVVISFLFQNLYAAAVSFGLISLVLGFALQAPIASFVAWVYLIFRRTYLVGDRIQVKGFRGDVVSISYFDTSILECNGDFIDNDRRSGRIIRFPNSLILREEVINFSGPELPFIWNEVAVQVAFNSDLQYVEDCLLSVATQDFEEYYPSHSNPIIKNREPFVYFRNNKFAWMEAVVSYPTKPTDMTARRNRILKQALPLLNQDPDRVKFPDGVRR